MSNLAFIGMTGAVELVVVILIWVIMAVLPILAVIWFARKTMENKRENLRLRLEVGKLADELEQIRKQQHA